VRKVKARRRDHFTLYIEEGYEFHFFFHEHDDHLDFINIINDVMCQYRAGRVIRPSTSMWALEFQHISAQNLLEKIAESSQGSDFTIMLCFITVTFSLYSLLTWLLNRYQCQTAALL
jgi:hypothetical protein